MSQTTPFILVDGSSYLYRAYHALPPLTNAQGQATGAIYGVVNMLRRLIRDYTPERVAIVFDAKGKTFRNDLYCDYKANRPPMPDNLREQIEPLHDVVRAMGFPLLMIEGVEADDVIGTLAQQATQQQITTIISTGDKDMAQLVNEHVTLVNTMTNVRTDHEAVQNKYGIAPNRIIDFLALMGDKVDNIPGVPDVGAKTATKLLQQYDSLNGVIENASTIKGKIGEKIRAASAKLPLSYQLATIKLDVKLEDTPLSLTMKEQDNDTLISLFRQLDFKDWVKALAAEHAVSDPSSANSPAEEPALAESCHKHETIVSQDQLDRWILLLDQAPLFAINIETCTINYMSPRIAGFSFAIEGAESAYLPVSHDYLGSPKQLSLDSVLTQLTAILEDPNKYKVGHNLKACRHALLNHGIDLQGVAHDVMLQSYVLDSTATKHDLNALAQTYLHQNIMTLDVIAGKGKKQLPFNLINLEKAGAYASQRASVSLALHHALWPKVQEHPSITALYMHVEIPLVAVLTHIERHGVNLDSDMLIKQGQDLGQKSDVLEKQAWQIAGEQFNLSSPKQLQSILYTKLELPVLKKTPKGQPSTAESVLQELANDGHELPQIIMRYRRLTKLKSTYTDKLPGLILGATDRIHTTYHQAVTATGRLSSSDPNLQNIPIRSEEGRQIREAFVAPKGHVILAADYSQVELRIMAHLSQDPGLLAAFSAGKDIHSNTAAEIFGVKLSAVSDDQRRSAKAINFGLIYGMSAHGLSKQLGIERKQAAKYIDVYFNRYPGVKVYMDSICEHAKADGYVETLFGRRLYLPEINASNGMRRQFAERTAINAPMQGTAADIIKRAMIDIDTWLMTSDLKTKMVIQVHDELVFEVPRAEVDEVKIKIDALMSSATQLDVPLVVSIDVGDNWEQAH